MRPDSPRPLYAGPDDGPESPFPVKVSGKVIKGFGRGSKELGIPTANIPVEGLSIGGHEDLASGVYFGWAGLDVRREDLARRVQEQKQGSGPEPEPKEQTHNNNNNDTSTKIKTSHLEEQNDDNDNGNNNDNWPGHDQIFPMVMSIGWNPFYKNTVRSLEVHILAPPFPADAGADFYGAHLALVILGFIRPEYDYVSVGALIADIRTDIEVARRSLARPAYRSWRADGWLLGEIGIGIEIGIGGGGGEDEEKRDVVR